jgi:hypothetical protein
MVYYKDVPNDIVYGYDDTDPTQDPYIAQAILNGWTDITGSWPPATVYLPPDSRASSAANQTYATSLLAATDWAATVDIATVTNTPYLSNQAAFLVYRDSVRYVAVNGGIGTVWPTLPTATWLP